MASPSRKPREDAESFASQDEILLGVLTAVDRDANISQRTMSRELGVALGLANAYLKRCVRKGWVKVQQVPRRRYVYYLTPQGFAEKTRLAGEYLTASFTFFRRARAQISVLMEECVQNGWRRVAFAGISELAEVATLCAHEFPLDVRGIIDGEGANQQFCGLPVWATLAECGPIDAIIITNLDRPQELYEELAAQIGADRILAPHMLHIAMPAAAIETSQRAQR